MAVDRPPEGRPSDEVREAEKAAALMLEWERRLDGRVSLLPALTDRQIDAIEPRVPEPVRIMLRATAGFHFGMDSLVIAPPPGPDSIWGPGREARIVLTINNGDNFLVDVDPETGEWGAVFSTSADYFHTYAYCARSLAAWLIDYVRDSIAALAAVERRDTGEGEDEEEDEHPILYACDGIWDGGDEPLPGTLVGDLRAGADPDLAAAIVDLPDEAALVDLRGLQPPRLLRLEPLQPSNPPYGWEEFRRCGPNRAFVAAVPILPRDQG